MEQKTDTHLNSIPIFHFEPFLKFNVANTAKGSSNTSVSSSCQHQLVMNEEDCNRSKENERKSVRSDTQTIKSKKSR